MATAIHETELKYDAPAGTPLPELLDLGELPHVASQSAAATVKLDATYYDTAAYDLARAGITLRRRTGGKDAGWHLKVPEGAASTRTELGLPQGSEPPAEFVELLTARLRGRPLHPVATITTRRSLCALVDADGSPLAEIAHDTVTAAAMGSEAALKRWTEVEVELAADVDAGQGARLLKAADRTLRSRGLTPSAHRMKLAAALADALPQEPELRLQKAGAADVVRAYLREQCEQLLRMDLLVRRSEADAIHRMRVAARRSRAALQEFGTLFGGLRTQQLINELRWLGQELGAARDQEVLRDLFLRQLDEIPVESVLGPVRARIAGHFAPLVADAERRVGEVLNSPRYLDLLNDLEDFVAAPPSIEADAEEAQRPAKRALPRMVRRSQRRVGRRMRAATQSLPGERDSALHSARKAAKRARYAAEAASLALGKKPRKSAKALKKLQSSLGRHQDAAIASDVLRTVALRAHAEGENAYTYGLLHERLAAHRDRSAEHARHDWLRANRRKRTAWMKS
ncbi:CYTH and CHAD domain-containing protein [Actinospica robiniae]|uniref:CYTH and CHAD domain-containing protein n=1 Tax=Actinospica robiniae TaxID=304901 RepID=UPI000402A58E|nr:CYTH and CHAD domain-containing protein [Actinospica robiniae]